MGGPEKWQKRGRAKRVLSRFCREEDNTLKTFYANLRKRAPLSFIIFREIFFCSFRHFYSQSISDRSQPMSGRYKLHIVMLFQNKKYNKIKQCILVI